MSGFKSAALAGVGDINAPQFQGRAYERKET
jgi:hypothetical protein